MDLKKEIKEHPILLVLVPKENFKDCVLQTIKAMESVFAKSLFVSISRPYSTVKAELKKNNISAEKFNFIDALTSTVKEPPKTDDCIFVSSPNDLTEIGVAFSNSLRMCDAAIVDSVSTLLIYSDKNSVSKFVHTLVTKARTLNKSLVFIALKEDSSSELIKEIYIFVNKAITL